MNRQSYGQISKGIQYENLVTFPDNSEKRTTAYQATNIHSLYNRLTFS